MQSNQRKLKTCCKHASLRAPIVVLACCVLPMMPSLVRAGDKPNIVLILADDLGYHDLSCHGSGLYQTPNIDRLASESVRFDRAYAAPTCSPSRSAILSGKNPARLGIVGHGGIRSMSGGGEFLAPEVVTLAETLTTAGYNTCHIGKWHVGVKPSARPESQGFQQVIAANGFCCPGSYFYPFLDKQKEGKARRRSAVPDLESYEQGDHLTAALGDEAARYIAAQVEAEQPFFLNLWYYAVHTPIQANPEKVQKYSKLVSEESHQRNPNYAALVEHLDESVGRVLDELDKHGLAENTVVIFYSDNGGEVRRDVTSNHPLRSGKATLYEGGIRVPLFVRHRGAIRPGSRSEFAVAGQDLYPTVVALAGQELAVEDIDGVDLSHTLADPDVSIDSRSIHWIRYGETFHYRGYRKSKEHGPCAAILKGNWKMIEHFPTPAGLSHRFELFNLEADPSESNDLSAVAPETLSELQRELTEWRRDAGVPSYREFAWPAFEKVEAAIASESE